MDMDAARSEATAFANHLQATVNAAVGIRMDMNPSRAEATTVSNLHQSAIYALAHGLKIIANSLRYALNSFPSYENHNPDGGDNKAVENNVTI